MRGPHVEDARAFDADALLVLRRAAEELRWLLGRGYPSPSALATVGNHHQLTTRQRVALSRCCAAPAACADRLARKLTDAALHDADVHVDALNLIITLEVALAGGPLLRGDEGALRDLAGLRGSYRLLPETRTAAQLVRAHLHTCGARSAQWWIDAPVSNSGRLRALLLDTDPTWSATLVADADRELFDRSHVISADALVLDRCRSWIDLASSLVATQIEHPWVIDLRT